MLQSIEDLNHEILHDPEIIIGLVGPIGVNLGPVQESIIAELELLKYRTEFIKVTDLMQKWDVGSEDVTDSSFSDYYQSLINYADKFRSHCKSHGALAALCIDEIRNRRYEFWNRSSDAEKISNEERGSEKFIDHLSSHPIRGTAYLIRQFKLPQEIELMRRTYGRKFIQISVYLNQEERRISLIQSIQKFNSKKVTKPDAETQAIQLIEIDSNEESEEYGQRITDVFHLGDVFVNGKSVENVNSTIKRFFLAFFGNNAISPTKMEYGMYTAAGAALRSIDLSRQVGAAIFSKAGEVLTLGCNEVPKAFGGTYWEDDTVKCHRDFEEGSDANQNRKTEILHDFIGRLSKIGFLKESSLSADRISEQVDFLLSDSIIKKSEPMDIIEFGRMVHAEMNAITDSARLGKSVSGSTLFCTTFPCHMCAKHIVSSGITRVVFLEPYPKSYAEELHSDSITFEQDEAPHKVLFEPFIGISPRRYRDIFEKKKRKDDSGKIRPWFEGRNQSFPAPRIEDRSDAYIENEKPSLAVGGLKNLIIKACRQDESNPVSKTQNDTTAD